MPILPSPLERLLVRCNLVPGPMLDFLGAEAFRALSAAQRLGVFDARRAGPVTTDEVARALGTNARGTGQLLAALEATGYLEQRSGRRGDARGRREGGEPW